MAQMGWGSYLETGHLEIDTQHKTLVDLVNQLDAATLNQGGAKRLKLCCCD